MEIIKLQQLQENFNSAIEKSIDQKFDINNEIDEALSYALTIPEYTPSFRKPSYRELQNKSNRIFELEIADLNRVLFRDSFKNWIRLGNYDLEKSHTDTIETYEIKENTVKQAIEFAQYYKWLKELQNQPIKKLDEEHSMPIKQKLLVLHYLGMNTTEYDNTKCAEILAEVLGVGSENIRKSLSHLHAGRNNTVRTKNNLEKVKILFDTQGLTKISNQIKEDLEKF